MTLGLTEEHRDLAAAIRGWAQRNCPADVVRAGLGAGVDTGEAAWAEAGTAAGVAARAGTAGRMGLAARRDPAHPASPASAADPVARAVAIPRCDSSLILLS